MKKMVNRQKHQWNNVARIEAIAILNGETQIKHPLPTCTDDEKNS